MTHRACSIAVLLAATLCAVGCDGDSSETADAAVDLAVPDMAVTDQALPPDMAEPDMAEPDMGPPPDMGPEVDMEIPPDLGPMDGPPCDPRLRARTDCDIYCCDPGSFCVPVPNGRPDNGRCQVGEGCRIDRSAPENGCPEDRPYCHLKGASTVCTAAGVLQAGEDCVDRWGVPQPCAPGLVCNNSVCQAPCDPAAEDPGCPDEGICFDIGPTIGIEGGLCGPRVCSWFTGEGCEPGRKCSLVIRNDGSLVGTCSELDGQGNADGAACSNLDTGGDNCGSGLYCTRPPGRPSICRTLCDTGGYHARCPGVEACEERLQFSSGVARGLGICITNQ